MSPIETLVKSQTASTDATMSNTASTSANPDHTSSTGPTEAPTVASGSTATVAPESKTRILLSIQIRCFKDLVRYGAEQALAREYGPYVVSPEPGFDFSVLIDVNELPDDQGVYKVVSSFTYTLEEQDAGHV